MTERFDVVVLGAGISGIAACWHLKHNSSKSFVCLERRKTFGGTWDLFKYPGLRSDSDMFTFGYSFKPWPSAQQIAPAADILDYAGSVIKDGGLEPNIRYNHHIISADWTSEDATWRITCDNGARFESNFLFICSGYYDGDRGHEVQFEGEDTFIAAGGQIVHTQKWESGIDYKDKRVAVIGSGATAVTIVPVLAKDAKHVTMVQRSPTYILGRPNADPIAARLQKLLPASVSHPLIRWKNVLLPAAFEVYAKAKGRKTMSEDASIYNRWLIKMMRQCIKKDVMDDVEFAKHFTPKYNLWEQRLCLTPDFDFFKAINKRKASVSTDHISHLDEKGIVFKSGDRVDCDLVVTATGLKLQDNFPMATMSVTVDGKPYVAREHFIYKGFMLSDVPNFVFTRGYFDASFTLRSDLNGAYICRLMKYMDSKKYRIACPKKPGDITAHQHALEKSGNGPGYVLRSLDSQPKNGSNYPWAASNDASFMGIRVPDYVVDRFDLGWRRFEDGTLEFEKAILPLTARL
eukprot:gnl/MRDRNA2_/MRDRNA2_63827_c0_seq2.p1 gnl/MRDRNA2_/MRDRNA2_63827_c0~~gnl/MRDRNA2_/MRDRNA2_63827_c0_seq2.p1  ORF type:complete len:518 (+),score=81.14 gnl/MRDRNA2_/MRDRNA2_63827_c0_seq2:89-1642(+)